MEQYSSVLTCGCETWVISEEVISRMRVLVKFMERGMGTLDRGI